MTDERCEYSQLCECGNELLCGEECGDCGVECHCQEHDF